MKKITLSLLFIASIFFANDALAQKKVKAYGFQLYALSDWEVDKEKGKGNPFVMISSTDWNADLTIEEHPISSSKEENIKTIMKFFTTNGALTKEQMVQYGKPREFVKNGLRVHEVFVKTPYDEDGESIWFKVWLTENKSKTKMVLFGAYNSITKGKSSTDHIMELEGILDSITPL